MRLKPLTTGFVIFVGIFAMMTTIDIQAASLVTNELATQREVSHIIEPPHDRLLVSDEVHVVTGHEVRAIFDPFASRVVQTYSNTRLIELGFDGITNQTNASTATCIVLIPASLNVDYEYLGSDDNPDDCHAGYVDEDTGLWVGGFHCDDDAQGYYCPFGELIQDTTDYQYYCRIENDC